MLVIQALGRLRQEDYKFKASLGYTAGSCHKKTKQTKNSIHSNPI
jgi:hypothetical protein